jgi:hypothetical protein
VVLLEAARAKESIGRQQESRPAREVTRPATCVTLMRGRESSGGGAMGGARPGWGHGWNKRHTFDSPPQEGGDSGRYKLRAGVAVVEGERVRGPDGQAGPGEARRRADQQRQGPGRKASVLQGAFRRTRGARTGRRLGNSTHLGDRGCLDSCSFRVAGERRTRLFMMMCPQLDQQAGDRKRQRAPRSRWAWRGDEGRFRLPGRRSGTVELVVGKGVSGDEPWAAGGWGPRWVFRGGSGGGWVAWGGFGRS